MCLSRVTDDSLLRAGIVTATRSDSTTANASVIGEGQSLIVSYRLRTRLSSPEVHFAHYTMFQIVIREEAVTIVSQTERDVVFFGTKGSRHHLDDDRHALF